MSSVFGWGQSFSRILGNAARLGGVLIALGAMLPVAKAQVSPNYQTGIAKRGSQDALVLPKVQICAASEVSVSGASLDVEPQQAENPRDCRGSIKTLSPKETEKLRRELIGPAD